MLSVVAASTGQRRSNLAGASWHEQPWQRAAAATLACDNPAQRRPGGAQARVIGRALDMTGHYCPVSCHYVADADSMASRRNETDY